MDAQARLFGSLPAEIKIRCKKQQTEIKKTLGLLFFTN